MTTIVFLLILLLVAHRIMKPEERTRFLENVILIARTLKEAGRSQLDPFRSALRARTHLALVTPALVATNVALFFWMAAAGGEQDAATLIRWGAGFGPRCTNGEWWRLLTEMFVHAGVGSLLVNMAALLQVGLMLERLVGPLAFSTTYVAAGIFAGLASMSTHPIAVTSGASGAVFGVYGLLMVAIVNGWRRPSPLTIPRAAIKRLVPLTTVFMFYSLASGRLGAAEIVGLTLGIVVGLASAKNLSEQTPPPRQLALAAGASLLVAVIWAIPLRGMADVRPEIERIVTLEARTTAAYQAAADRFRKGAVSTEALVQLIDRTIVPELDAADARIASLQRVPQDDAQSVADARLYLRLRSESWRLRSRGLRETSKPASAAPKTADTSDVAVRVRAEARHRSNLQTLGKAEGAERAALEALRRIKPSASG